MALLSLAPAAEAPLIGRQYPHISPQQAATELIRRRGLIQENSGPLSKALLEYKAGKLYPDELIHACERYLSIKLPFESVCGNHQAPGQYVLDSLVNPGMDAVVWAGRGTGKTMAGALLSLIESIYWDRCETRILGGSEEQSGCLYEHITGFIYAGGLEEFVKGKLYTTYANFKNRSKASMMAASEKSVRGKHPPRLRLDEVDLFEPRIYKAAIPTRMSKNDIPSALHIYSTMNRAGGLMDQVVSETVDSGRKLYTWCIWEVAEKCVGRECSACVLWEDCRGKCLKTNGYYKISDIIKIKTQPGFDQDDFDSEILCKRPGSKFLIWPRYDEVFHLVDLINEPVSSIRIRMKTVVAGVDWGYVNPTVILVVGEDSSGIVWILEEYRVSYALPEETAATAKKLLEKWKIEAFFCDPEEPSSIARWRKEGLPCYKAKNNVELGLKEVGSRFILHPHRKPLIQIDKSCAGLRKEVKTYRKRGEAHKSGRGDASAEDIVKKNDHGPDALRYGILGLKMMNSIGGY